MTGLVLATFALLSIPAIVVSWPSIRRPGSHGFYRFFGFEGTLLLILLNLTHWFRDPLSPIQACSWLMLAASLLLAVHSFRLLHTRGGPADSSIESTTTLVRVGAYRFIRHPLYASLLLLAGGAFLKNPSWGTAVLLGLTAAFYFATAVAEERQSLAKFGGEYAAYMRATRRFIPFVF